MRSAKVAANRRPATIPERTSRQAVAAYLAGGKPDVVGPLFGIDPATVLRFVHQAGVTVRTRKTPPEISALMAAEYASGVSSTRLAKKYGSTVTTVLDAVRKAGVAVRPLEERHTLFTLNECAFDAVTEASAYWVGMLITDGNVSKRGHYVTLALQEADRHQIEKFRCFLGSGHKICRVAARVNRRGVRSGPQARLSVASRRLCAALATFGVVPNKTETAKVLRLESSAPFWRGAVDGDGWVTITRQGYPQLGLVGSPQLTRQFVEYVRLVSPGCRATPRPRGKVCAVTLTGRHGRRLMEVLYGGGEVSLDRKQAVADRVLSATAKRIG
jgi:hypothetical protein